MQVKRSWTAKTGRTLAGCRAATDPKGRPRRGPKHPSHHQTEVGMTRTDVMASSRPGTTGSRTTGRTKAPRGLLALPIIALVMAFALLSPAGALAAEETSSYGQTTTAPTTTHETEPTKT